MVVIWRIGVEAKARQRDLKAVGRANIHCTAELS
jgi:hypothetical protein